LLHILKEELSAGMRRGFLRLLIIVPIVGVWLISAPFVLRDRESKDAVVAVTRAVATASDAWWREDAYYVRVNNRRATIIAEPQTGVVAYRNPERIRILLIGDSFTYGTGLRDMDRRLGYVLESMLNAATSDGTFEVVSMAYPGASTFTQAAWLRQILENKTSVDFIGASTVKDIGHLLQPFDALIVGYVSNDRFTYQQDLQIEIPEEYQAAVRRTHGEASILQRYVDAYQYLGEMGLSMGAAVEKGTPTPNDPYYPLAVQEIRSFLANKPALVMPLILATDVLATVGRGEVGRGMDEFKKAGFTIINDETSAAVRQSTPVLQLMVTAVDHHPGTRLLQAYATDMSKAILSSIPNTRLAEAERGAIESQRPLVSNYLPLELSIVDGGGETEVAFDGEFEIERKCLPSSNSSGWHKITCDDGVAAMYGRDGTEWSMQYTPCVPLGRTFAQVMFHKGYRENIEVLLQTGEPVQLYSIEYTPSGEELFFDVGTLRAGGSATLNGHGGSAGGVRGIAISPTAAAGGRGCTTEQPGPARLTPFTITIRASKTAR